jgi:hypothetical protein
MVIKVEYLDYDLSGLPPYTAVIRYRGKVVLEGNAALTLVNPVSRKEDSTGAVWVHFEDHPDISGYFGMRTTDAKTLVGKLNGLLTEEDWLGLLGKMHFEDRKSRDSCGA